MIDEGTNPPTKLIIFVNLLVKLEKFGSMIPNRWRWKDETFIGRRYCFQYWWYSGGATLLPVRTSYLRFTSLSLRTGRGPQTRWVSSEVCVLPSRMEPARSGPSTVHFICIRQEWFLLSLTSHDSYICNNSKIRWFKPPPNNALLVLFLVLDLHPRPYSFRFCTP